MDLPCINLANPLILSNLIKLFIFVTFTNSSGSELYNSLYLKWEMYQGAYCLGWIKGDI